MRLLVVIVFELVVLVCVGCLIFALGLHGLAALLLGGTALACALGGGREWYESMAVKEKFEGLRKVVGEATASGAEMVDLRTVVTVMDDEWLTNMYNNVREEERAAYEALIEKGDASGR